MEVSQMFNLQGVGLIIFMSMSAGSFGTWFFAKDYYKSTDTEFLVKAINNMPTNKRNKVINYVFKNTYYGKR